MQIALQRYEKNFNYGNFLCRISVILDKVSAFANGLGGSLFYGIDNDGIVKGLDDMQHVCETISSRIRDYMDPLPDVEMIPHDIDGLHILQLKVNAGHYTPYYYVGDGQPSYGRADGALGAERL